MSDQEIVYEVQSIVSSRLNKGRKQYLVKWVGYGPSENTWEPEANLMNSHELLEEFKKNQNKKFIRCEKPIASITSTRSKKQTSINNDVKFQQGQKGKVYSRNYSSQSEMVIPEQNYEVFQSNEQVSESSGFNANSNKNWRKSKMIEKKEEKCQNDRKKKKKLTSQSEKLKILGIHREQDKIYYYVSSKSKERWVNRRYFSTSQLEQLCSYYQKNMLF